MRIAGAAQAELIKLAAMAAGLGLLVYLGYRVVNGTVKSIKDAATAIIDAPGKAVDAIKETARTGGQTWQAGIADSQASGQPPTPYVPRYANPMVNDSGMDFSQF